MLAEAPGVFYIHEPFSVTDPPSPGICNARFQYWFTYITSANELTFYRDMKNTLDLKYNWPAALKSCHSVEDFRKVRREWGLFRRHRLEGSRLLIKDPIALLSAEWLAGEFDMDVVILIRHPAAFVSSIKKLNWNHPFYHFIEQPALMKAFLDPFAAEIREYASRDYGVFDQAILLWKLMHYVILQYKERHKSWIYLRHEDVSRDPMTAFADLYERLNLGFCDHARMKILEYSDVRNPADTEAPVGSEMTLKRNSGLNVWNWKNRLTPTEIKTIRERVEPVSNAFYSDADW
jgi:hypothetical protein